MQFDLASAWPGHSLPRMKRHDGRAPDKIRPLSITPGIAPHAAGSVLIAAGNTRVICAASVEENVPRWMKEQGVKGGWLTAEYSMLPYSTVDRKPRDISKGRLDGRSSEIQRLIGRSLRAVVDLHALGSRTLCVDCDVLQADGGTRTASITGACVAVALAGIKLKAEGKVAGPILKEYVAAISVGVVSGRVLADLDYEEDKTASVDMNLVMTESGAFVEVQGTGEEATFTSAELLSMLDMGAAAIRELLAAQKALAAG